MVDSQEVVLEVATPRDAPLLSNLMELYLHDLSEVFPIQLGADGRFGYEKLPLYWSEPGNRFPFLIRCGTRVVGFALVHAIVAGLRKANSTETEAMIAGFEGAKFDTPFGDVMFRQIDHQSTMGAYVGKLALKDGRGTMVDWHYVDGADALPTDAEVRKMRPA